MRNTSSHACFFQSSVHPFAPFRTENLHGGTGRNDGIELPCFYAELAIVFDPAGRKKKMGVMISAISIFVGRMESVGDGHAMKIANLQTVAFDQPFLLIDGKLIRW